MKKKSIKKQVIPPTSSTAINNIKILLASIVSYLMLFWLFPVYTFIGLYALIGIMIGTINGKRRESTVLGIVVGILAGIPSSIFLKTENFIYYVQTMQSQIVSRDIPSSLYTEIFYNLVLKNPISYLGIPLYILATVILISLFSGIFSSIKSRKFGTYIFIFILSMNFLFISLISSRGIAEYASAEPPNYSYGYDALYYLKTSYVLDREPFYRALITAIKYDGRTKTAVEYNDRVGIYQWKAVPTTLFIRQPFIFYIWKYIGQGDLSRVVYFSILFCSLLLILSFIVSRDMLGEFSYLAPIAIFPFLFTGTVWTNVFFPDWWAGLFYLSGVLLWLSKKYWLSSLFFLGGLMSRGEVTIIIFLIFLFYALFFKKEALKPFAIIFLVFLIWFGVHYQRAALLIHPTALNRMNSPLSLLSHFQFEYFSSASYMMFFYGFFKLPIILIPVISVVSSFLKKYYELTLVSLYSIFHNGFHSSSYWGQHINSLVLFVSIIVISISMNDIRKIAERFKIEKK